jgi:hypothetical protein
MKQSGGTCASVCIKPLTSADKQSPCSSIGSLACIFSKIATSQHPSRATMYKIYGWATCGNYVNCQTFLLKFQWIPFQYKITFH